MVSRIETIAAIAERLRQQSQPVVLDPVMVATSGDRLLHEDAIETLRHALLPLAAIVTPNLPEAALLTGTPIAETEQEITRQAELILNAGAKAVLIKGGHGDGPESTDYLFADGAMQALSAPRVETKTTTAPAARSRPPLRLTLRWDMNCGRRSGLRRII